ncbi:hypothetical protein SAMN02745216_04626 [Desulfatibacillum alkenivorans DSM 16219]|jgi:hypothetical protein|uniref:Uncharacterized protein n=1 Tax=Desulfatibacillum alkenivorans DSM 16219 TaxID=1121393 RepID=A0A1M6XYM6_9BACT|nr:hypothetical protein [Desulfatibacillum alkenivorans]SHL10979.1 hypothetical protein SAMN02745216_04626 [Desulfatibacillum alkenivorans DSM 16219]
MIKYAFEYTDGAMMYYELDENAYYPEAGTVLEGEWLNLEEFKCRICTIDPETHPQCPAAMALWPVLRDFGHRISHEPVNVQVDWTDVHLEAVTSTQQAVRSMVGLMLALCRCPVMEKLRPMAHFHLPFADAAHTQFRVLGMYLIAQYLRENSGMEPDWTLEGLLQNYRELQHANRRLAERIRAASETDAAVNGLIILDALAQSVEMGINQNLKKLRPLFEMYMDPE